MTSKCIINAFCLNFQEVETDQFYNFFLPELKKDGYDGVFSPKSRAKTMSENDRKRVDGCAIFFRAIKLVYHYYSPLCTIYTYIICSGCDHDLCQSLGVHGSIYNKIISGFWHTCIRFDNLYQLNTCLLYIHISFGFPILETNPRPLLIGIYNRICDGIIRVVGVLVNLFPSNYVN